MDINQLTARHGFDPADRDRVVRWAGAAGLQVTGEDAATRRVLLRGSAGQLSRAFDVDLERFGWQLPDVRNVEYRGHTGPVRLPAHLDRVVEGVYGLDDRPLARSHVRGLDDGRSAVFAYDPPQLALLYDFPRLANGGEGVELVAAMIELGGVVHPFDLAASFARLGLPAPDITNVWLDGATPTPDPNGADVEVALDYQVIGGMVAAMAPKAHLTIVSYNAPNSERGFIDAAATAASDAMRRPAAVSISWGAPEDHWSPQGMRGLDAAFAAGALHGVTFSAAAGDAGSTNAEVDGYQHPEFPASSAHAWACGGTTLLAARGRIRTETVWNELARGAGAAGSGVSSVFPVPAYQAALGIRPRSADGNTLGRGLPDGAGNADPLTGWNIVALRRLRATGGTSAVAPMYTALWTLVSSQLGHRIGLPHSALYAKRGRGFNDVTSGDTGGPYRAGRGWDLASGWGSPDGRQIARDLGVRVQGPDARRPRIERGEREIA
jgi:kumamolisin